MKKSELDKHLFAQNRAILDILPESPADSLDEFILQFLGKLAVANQGSGFDAIQASLKLEAMREMSYAELRMAAGYSPDYADFERQLIAEREKAAVAS